MAYQARRKRLYQEDFELVDEYGVVVKKIQVALDPDQVATELSRKHLAFIRASEKLSKTDPDKEPVKALEIITGTTIDILQVVFGEEDTQFIVGFYNGIYLEIAQEVLPFVFQIVIPKVRKMAQENKAKIVTGYSRNSGRKSLFGKK